MGVGGQHLDLLIPQGSRPWAPAMTMEGRVHDCQLPPGPAPQGKLHTGFQAVALTHQRMLLETRLWDGHGGGTWVWSLGEIQRPLSSGKAPNLSQIPLRW